MAKRIPTLNPLPIRHTMPHVFTEAFISNLSAANAVARQLRAMGYQIIAFAADTPEIRIKADTFPNMRRLQEMAGTYRHDGNRCHITLGGITVSWEPATAKSLTQQSQPT